jgi:four helix bundle protein
MKVAKGYEDLDVYKRAFAQLRPIHDLVLRFPDFERFDLASQMRRACKSVVANIAEGYGRRVSTKEFCRFLDMALGSANEMQTHLDIARELDYVTQEEYQHHINEYRIIARQLHALIKYWRSMPAPATSD